MGFVSKILGDVISNGGKTSRRKVQENVLKSLGWRIIHIWSLGRFEDRNKEFQRIKREIDTKIDKNGEKDEIFIK